MFERRPGQIRFVENLPSNFPRNWISRTRSNNVQNEPTGMRRSNNKMVVRRNRNPFRNQSSGQMNFNIHEIFGAIGESVSMGKCHAILKKFGNSSDYRLGIERGVSAAVRIIAEQGIPIKMNHPRDVIPEDSPSKIRASTPFNDPIDVISTPDVEENIAPEKGVMFGLTDKTSGEKLHVDMIPIDEVERLLNMARQQVSKDEQMVKLPVADAPTTSDQLVKSMDSLISAEMREELANNPDYDVFDHVSKETPSQAQNAEMYGAKVIDLTTPSLPVNQQLLVKKRTLLLRI